MIPRDVIPAGRSWERERRAGRQFLFVSWALCLWQQSQKERRGGRVGEGRIGKGWRKRRIYQVHHRCKIAAFHGSVTVLHLISSSKSLSEKERWMDPYFIGALDKMLDLQA